MSAAAEPAAVFAAVAVALYAAHQLADHRVKTNAQAAGKPAAGWPGRLACARHAATYRLTASAMLSVTALTLGLQLRAGPVAAALAVSAVSHYWADRRAPLAALAARTRAAGFYRLNNRGLNGAYLLDQAWHTSWLLVATPLIAGGAR